MVKLVCASYFCVHFRKYLWSTEFTSITYHIVRVEVKQDNSNRANLAGDIPAPAAWTNCTNYIQWGRSGLINMIEIGIRTKRNLPPTLVHPQPPEVLTALEQTQAREWLISRALLIREKRKLAFSAARKWLYLLMVASPCAKGQSKRQQSLDCADCPEAS